MKLINVDDIEWQKGVFVNPTTEEPLPIIHKIATIEMLRDWQEEVKAVPLDNVKQARAEIKTYKHGNGNMYTCGLNKAVEILDKLIESEE